MAVVISVFRRLAVVELDQLPGFDGLLHHRANGEIAKRLGVDLAVGQEGERAILVPGLPSIRGARRIAHIGVDDRRHLAADLVGIAVSAADPSTAAIIADAFVPVGRRRQPDLDADALRIRARGRILFRGDARSNQQLHQAEFGSGNDRGFGHVGRAELLALFHQPNRHNSRVGVGMEIGLDAIVTCQRLRRCGRQLIAHGEQEHRKQAAGCNFPEDFQDWPSLHHVHSSPRYGRRTRVARRGGSRRWRRRIPRSCGARQSRRRTARRNPRAA